MTGIADVYLYLRKPRSQETRAWLKRLFAGKNKGKSKFVLLSWKRTGSNLFCGILYNHPEIVMHNELFNTIDIFTYFPASLATRNGGPQWNVLARDLHPEAFLNYIWLGTYSDGTQIRQQGKAVGFKSFPEHWRDSCNLEVWQDLIMDNPEVKKIVLHRQDELAVYVSMLRAEKTGCYMTHKYPDNLKVHVDPAQFQRFVNNYRDTFQRKYKSIMSRSETFRLTYEQLVSKSFASEILPLLWKFLGVDEAVVPKTLADTVKQSREEEDISDVISNFEDLEFCFRHTDVKFSESWSSKKDVRASKNTEFASNRFEEAATWSILLPICSRPSVTVPFDAKDRSPTQNVNRFSEIERSSSYNSSGTVPSCESWDRLKKFSKSLASTTTEMERRNTECIVGIDVDDPVFSSKESRSRIRSMIPVTVEFVNIGPKLYGKVCRIWNCLARNARNDFVVLLGDDVELVDGGWQNVIARKFEEISDATGLPFGAGCVSFNDLSFPGYPTFPVVHRWHLCKFGRLLPRQFVNQGGDPFLFALYSRWNASSLVLNARLTNSIGGDSAARYIKHSINWPGQILKTNIENLEIFLDGRKPFGICLDVVVPSFRVENDFVLRRIVSLRSSISMQVRFWIIVDNPDPGHVRSVRDLAHEMNKKLDDGNYFVNVISYERNRGASYARNVGYNYSTADWVLFLDDDIMPEPELLDAYAGAIRRYPDARVMVGLTEFPDPCNTWTFILASSNVMFFYGIANRRVHPPWGVTANLLVRGSRHNQTIQFKDKYPNTGGGEDIDFCFQMKKHYGGQQVVVSVPGARVRHPWWREGKVCYGQIAGWAWGDSLCISEWPHKTFLVFPNWCEFLILCIPVAFGLGSSFMRFIKLCVFVIAADHLVKIFQFFRRKTEWNLAWSVFLALGAGTVISCQEMHRVAALLRRGSFFSFSRRMDWFDDQACTQVLEQKLRSAIIFSLYALVAWFLLAC